MEETGKGSKSGSNPTGASKKNARSGTKARPQHSKSGTRKQSYNNKGALTQGTLNINARDWKNAFVHQSNGGNDINIQGVKDRNGALHGDDVLICDKSREQWIVLHSRVRDYLETERDTDYRLLLKGAKTSDGNNFNYQSSDDEGAEDRKVSKHHPPPSIRKKKKRKFLNDKEWVIDDLPSVSCNSAISQNIPIISLKNNAPPPVTVAKEKKPIEILTPDALDSSPPITSANGSKPAVSVISLESLKKEVAKIDVHLKESSDIENHDTDEEDSKSKTNKKHKRRRKRSNTNTRDKNPDKSTKTCKTLKLPEGLIFDIESVLKHKNASLFLQKTAYVIKVLKRNHSRISVGFLKPFSMKDSEYILFSPLDSRVPRMQIPINQAPEDFLLNPQNYANILYIAKIKEWNSFKFALGTLVESIGDMSSIEAQTKGSLISNGIDESDFSEEVAKCLPTQPFSIPQEEYEKRRDFTNECVFTIDPKTARDLDDALSIEKVDGNRYKVGVHIADVSYFVRKDTELDKCAADRGTSVYLVHRVIPMLPRELCENLCSLNPDVPRLTFSVEWIITEDGKIESTWFGRSIIKSVVKLAYEHAQEMLDNPSKEWKSNELPPISSPWKYSDIATKVGMLQKIAVNLRDKRKENGSLRLDLPKVCFSLNADTGIPQGFYLYQHRHSNKLIEEFMLLANISVAEKIYKHMPELAVLRCHPPPKKAMMSNLSNCLKQLNYHIDHTSSHSLASSLEKYSKSSDPSSKKRYQLLVTLMTKPMDLARYFCTGTVLDEKKFRHYALNVPFYTHFTSPIRRYPDIMVHRILDAILQKETLTWKSEDVHKAATHCNKKRIDARNVSQTSQDIFLTQFIFSCGPVENLDCVVLEVKDHSLDVLIVDMAIVQRIYLNQHEDLDSFEYSSSRGIKRLVLKWKMDQNQKNNSISVLTVFAEIKCTLKKHDTANRLNTIIIRPTALV
ncbi:DIS3-like exonuclease 2 [Lepeophtheirus salmonis]|uniref:DIS3-like exonuclease 2 n=1 Tax=Lepeophtheirus salmonis TaxID=72036 RepID=UPI003AF36EC5